VVNLNASVLSAAAGKTFAQVPTDGRDLDTKN